MTTATFDTLKLAEDFITGGFNEKEAHVLAEKFGLLANEHSVTKETLKNELEKLELRLIIKIAVLVTAILGFFRVMEAFFRI